MRKVQLEQGSPEWHQWRKSLLTSTDAPMLLGVSPYVTPFKGWQRKLSLVEEQQETEAMRRGRRDEPIAREIFNRRSGLKMESCVIESSKYNFIGASLDGISSCDRYLLEVKSNNSEWHNLVATKKQIPEFHMYQVQHALLSSDNQAEKAYYGSYHEEELAIVEVFPDMAWYSVYLEKAREFWKKVVMFDPPPLSDKDYINRSSDEKWIDLSSKYEKVNDEIKRLEKEKESYKNSLIEIAESQSSCGNGIKLIKKNTKGRIDYDAILSLSEVDTILKQNQIDLEKFRKPTTSSWTILVDSK
jgi:putative phage-type endonuclease